VRRLDRAVAGRIERLQRRHHLARGEHLNLEFVVGEFGDLLGEILGAAIDRIERFRKARRHAPFDFRCALRDRR
jgi:hypothetical protein